MARTPGTGFVTEAMLQAALAGFEGGGGVAFSNVALGSWSGPKVVAAAGGAVRLHSGTLTGDGSLSLIGSEDAEVSVFVNLAGHVLTWGGQSVTGNGQVVLGASCVAGTWRYWGGSLSVTEPPPVTDTTPPSVVTGLATPTITATSVRLTWDAATDDVGVAHYEVTRTGSATVHEVPSGNPVFWPCEWTFEGLDPATTYTLSIRAVDLSGNTSASWSTIAATTASGSSNTAPTAPTNLQGTPGQTTMDLTWGAASDDVGVVAYRVSSDGGSTWVTESVTSLAYTVTDLAPGTSYNFEVQAGDIAGLWGPSATLTASTLVPVTDDSILAFAFDEGTGTTTTEEKTSTSVTVSSNAWITGKYGTGLAEGSAGSVTAGGADIVSLTGVTGLTIMGWVRVSSSVGPGVGSKAGLIGLYRGGTASVEANLIAGVGIVGGATHGSVAGVIARLESMAELTHTFASDVMPSGMTWHHVAMVWDDSTNTVTPYWNGAALSTTGTYTGTLSTGIGGINLRGWAANPTALTTLGKDDLRVFKRPLTAPEVAAFMEQGIG